MAGDIVYLRVLEHSNAARQIGSSLCRQPIEESKPEDWVCKGTVTKVGRKYFTVRLGAYDLQFDKGTEQQNAGGYSADYQLYRTETEALDDVRAGILIRTIRECFDKRYLTANEHGASITELEAIAKQLGITIPWEPKPRYVVAHLLICMHTHEYGVDGRAFAFSNFDAAYGALDWVKENKFNFEPDKGEQLDYDVCRAVLDLNELEAPSAEEITALDTDKTDYMRYSSTFPSNFREILLDMIQNVAEDYDLHDIDREAMADIIMAEPAFQTIKDYVAGVEYLEEDTEKRDHTVWAIYDYVESKLTE